MESFKLISDLKGLNLWICMLVGLRNIKNGIVIFIYYFDNFVKLRYFLINEKFSRYL